jgi:cold shock protein
VKTGYVKWFCSQKGYGYISPADGGFNVRVQLSEVRHAGLLELKDGQRINFEALADDRTGEILAVKLTAPTSAPADLVGSQAKPVGKWGSVRWLLAGRKTPQSGGPGQR